MAVGDTGLQRKHNHEYLSVWLAKGQKSVID